MPASDSVQHGPPTTEPPTFDHDDCPTTPCEHTYVRPVQVVHAWGGDWCGVHQSWHQDDDDDERWSVIIGEPRRVTFYESGEVEDALADPPRARFTICRAAAKELIDELAVIVGSASADSQCDFATYLRELAERELRIAALAARGDA